MSPAFPRQKDRWSQWRDRYVWWIGLHSQLCNFLRSWTQLLPCQLVLHLGKMLPMIHLLKLLRVNEDMPNFLSSALWESRDVDHSINVVYQDKLVWRFTPSWSSRPFPPQQHWHRLGCVLSPTSCRRWPVRHFYWHWGRFVILTTCYWALYRLPVLRLVIVQIQAHNCEVVCKLEISNLHQSNLTHYSPCIF